MITGQTSIWKAWPRPGMRRNKKEIVVKNNYYDAVWWGIIRRMNCMVPMIIIMYSGAVSS